MLLLPHKDMTINDYFSEFRILSHINTVITFCLDTVNKCIVWKIKDISFFS